MSCPAADFLALVVILPSVTLVFEGGLTNYPGCACTGCHSTQ